MATLDDFLFDGAPTDSGNPQSGLTINDFLDDPVEPAPEATPAAQSDGFSARNMISNIPGSFAGVVGDTAQAVLNPIDTGKGLIATLGGLIAKALPGETPSESAADPVIDYFRGRYGSSNGFLTTLEEDPAGVVADLAAFMSASGGALRGTRAGKILAAGGRYSDPVGLGLRATRNAGRIAESAAVNFYKRAAKFSTTIPLDVVDDATRALLKKNIPIGNVDKLRAVIAEEGAKLGAILSQADDAGMRISTRSILKSVDNVLAEAEKTFGGKSAQNVKALNRMRDELAAQFGGRKTIKPSELQASKLDISKDIKFSQRDTGGRSTSPTARIEQDALIAQRGEMKRLLEGIDNNIAKINSELGPLLEIEEPFVRASRRIGNRNLFSNVVSTGTGGFAGGSAMLGGATTPEALAIGVVTAAGVELARSPAVVSRGAIQLSRAGRALEALGDVSSNPFALSAAQAIATMERGRE